MKYRYLVNGLDCANCARMIEGHLNDDEKLRNVVLNFSTSKLSFEAEEDRNMKEFIELKISEIEDGVTLVNETENVEKNNVSKLNIAFLILGSIIGALTIIFHFDSKIEMILMIIAYVLLLWRIFGVACRKVFKNHVLDENTLIVISAIGAFLVGQTHEGMMVVILYEIGKILEDKAVNKTRRSVQELMDIKPEYANLKMDGRIESVMPEEVNIDDIIIIKSGEKIPLDGVVVSGKAKIDNSALTGETKLVMVEENSEVLSGSVNVDGFIEVKVTKAYKDSTVTKILELVENATDRKAKAENTVSKMAKVYTPIILILAVCTAIFLPLFTELTYRDSIYRALIFLVISCPCAIAISVPLTYFSGIGRASKSGILIKGSDYLDGLREISKVVFDKTGTLTTGNFSIANVKSLDEKYSEKDILKIAAIGEKNSNHPIAKSILKEVEEDISKIEVQEYNEIIGKGISFRYNESDVFVGTESDSENDGTTNILVKVNGILIGKILMQDAVKSDALEAIKELKKNNVDVAMFTGDKKDVALSVAKTLEIDDVNYEMLPNDKYQKMEEYLKDGRKIAFVGDGINDSPVLALSSVGIAMGGIGSSSSIEASDVVIMTDELKKIPEAIKISKNTNKIVKQNLTFALSMKILFLILGLFGVTTMWMAVFADVGVTILTVLNSIRNLKS